MRIYVVKFKEAEQLVEAASPKQAIMHVAAKSFSASAAKPADVARIMAAGGKVETVAAGERADD